MKLACCVLWLSVASAAAQNGAQNNVKLQQMIAEGRSLIGKGDAAGALDAFRTASHLAPKSAELHDEVGFLLAVLKRGAEAREQFQKAIALKGDYAPAHYHLGVSYCLESDYPSCIPELQKAVQIDPKSCRFSYRPETAS